jgi:hypothetical protein
MLMAGEVDRIEVISLPSEQGKEAFVRVYLHPNAVFNGRRLRRSFFTLETPGSDSKDSIEDRIRRAEAKKGIAPGEGVSIIYRNVIHRFLA